MLFRLVDHGQVEGRVETETGGEGSIEAVGARVVEVGGDGQVDGEPLVVDVELEVVALVLLAHVAEGVGGAHLVPLVDGDQVGEVEHVDLLQLGGRPVVRGHHVHRQVGVVDDLGVRLADTRRLQQHQVVPSGLHDRHCVMDVGRQGEVRLTGGQRPHVDPGMGKAVHPDPVAEQGSPGAAFRRVDRDDGDLHVLEVEEQTAQDLVDQRRLARATGTGDADHRGV